MKILSRYSFFLCFFIASVSCLNTGTKGTISGKIDGASGKSIYLESFINNRSVFTDSTVAGADGSFSLVPSRPLEMNFYRILVGNEKYVMLITDSTECPKISGNLETLDSNYKVDGSINSETLRDLEMKCEPFNKKEKESREKFSTPGISNEERAMINQQMIETRKQRTETIKTWLETNSSTPAALLAIQQLDPRTDMPLFNKVFSGQTMYTLTY